MVPKYSPAKSAGLGVTWYGKRLLGKPALYCVAVAPADISDANGL
jgi:hypothetical protein